MKNMYTDIIIKSIGNLFNVINTIADKNFVCLAPKKPDSIEWITIQWITSINEIQIQFIEKETEDSIQRTIKNASTKTLNELSTEIQKSFNNIDFNKHWRGYDNWRLA